MVITHWMQLTNLDVSANGLQENIPPEMGDLCELIQLEMDGNGFEGQIPTQLTQLFNLKKGQVSFANNQISGMDQEWIYFCPFGINIMANNPGGFERFVTICGDTCTGMEYDRLEDHPWLIDLIRGLDCSGDACFNRRVSSDAGFVVVRGVTVAYTRSRCFTEETVYEETIKFYDCGGYLLDTYSCKSDEFCPGIAVVSPEEFEALEFDSRWSCTCTGIECVPRDSIVIDAGEVDTLYAEEFVLAGEHCIPELFGIYAVSPQLPGDPPYVTEDHIGTTIELTLQNLISDQQCTTILEVVRGTTGTSEFDSGNKNGSVMIDCHPNPVVDVLSCPEIDMDRVQGFKVFNLQGREMPKQLEFHPDKLQLNVRDYPPGMYILLIREPERQMINRFTVIR